MAEVFKKDLASKKQLNGGDKVLQHKSTSQSVGRNMQVTFEVPKSSKFPT